MKKKNFYDPPRVESVTLQTEGFVCTSEETLLDNTVYFYESTEVDFSGLW